MPPDPRVVRDISWLSTAAAFLAIAIGLTALLGWALDAEAPRQWVSGHSAMKTNSALGTLALAFSLLLVRRRRDRLSAALAGFAVALGLLSAAERVFGVNLRIDELLFHARADTALATSPNRMAPNTAALLVLLGAALLLAPRRRRFAVPGNACALTAVAIAMVAAIGQVTGTRELTGLRGASYMSIPVVAALTPLALAIVFVRLDLGLARAFVRAGLDGTALRLSVIGAVVVPLALGGVRKVLVDNVGMSSRSASWLYTVAIIAVLVGWAVVIAGVLARALGAFSATAERLRAIVDSSLIAVVTFDEHAIVTSWNPAAERLLGWSAAEAVGHPYPLADEMSWADILVEIERTEAGDSFVIDRVRRRKDGTEVWVQISAAPLLAGDGSIGGVSVVLTDVTERRRAADELRLLNVELERRVQERTAELAAANVELQSFSYSISHDLRTPLRALDGFSQALLEDYGPELDDTARDYLGRIRGASQRMASLIDDVLGLSRVTRAELRRERVDVSELARAVTEELALADPERRVDVHVDDELVADGDPVLVRVVLQNLLENAWKFTRDEPEPRVEVTAGEIEGQLGFAVSDNGVGFPEQHRQKLFRPFQRLHSTAAFPGNGIGLATVANIVYRHGGSLGAESPVGGGARFTFTLGGAPAAPAGKRVLAGVGTGLTP